MTYDSDSEVKKAATGSNEGSEPLRRSKSEADVSVAESESNGNNLEDSVENGKDPESGPRRVASEGHEPRTPESEIHGAESSQRVLNFAMSLCGSFISDEDSRSNITPL